MEGASQHFSKLPFLKVCSMKHSVNKCFEGPVSLEILGYARLNIFETLIWSHGLLISRTECPFHRASQGTIVPQNKAGAWLLVMVDENTCKLTGPIPATWGLSQVWILNIFSRWFQCNFLAQTLDWYLRVSDTKTKTLHLDVTGELRFTNTTFNMMVDIKTLFQKASQLAEENKCFSKLSSIGRGKIFHYLGYVLLYIITMLTVGRQWGRNSWKSVSVQEIWLVMPSTITMYTAHCFFQHGLLKFYLFIFAKQNHLLSLFLSWALSTQFSLKWNEGRGGVSLL